MAQLPEERGTRTTTTRLKDQAVKAFTVLVIIAASIILGNLWSAWFDRHWPSDDDGATVQHSRMLQA